ncbi:heparan-alpha-glucosaminide N-acetyltransferase [Olsenella massiliensis]|uniref:heparan-alpha-glucosaminide N-acetyltransferase n=1 Tax=Olsenella massiliensis TaxID=1622075 RepID=UPI00071D46FD|nr:heparan-alpha-glucosaminide N-acetyltransferase [Olsenella massiliensis]
MATVDALKGLTVISMALFHWCYDLSHLFGVPLAFFRPPLLDVWRASISWTFLFVAGWMCSYSRSLPRRAARYLLVALGICAATSVAGVDAPISFGIIFCMGASTLLAALLGRYGLPRGGGATTLALVALFVLSLNVPAGFFGAGPVLMRLPQGLYATPWLAWLGFPDALFCSGDYYPLLPYGLMYLAGASFGRGLSATSTPTALGRSVCRPLEWLGRHSLVAYLVHQPLLLALGAALTGKVP